MFDLVVSGGDIVDGTGAPRRRADVAVVGGRIVAIGDLGAANARTRVESTGRVVCPGTIDPHAHVELALLAEGRVAARLAQGVTTEIVGQDGLSYAPLGPVRLAEQIDLLAGLDGRAAAGTQDGTWVGYRRRLDGRIAQNVAFLAPYGAVRIEVAGWVDRALTAAERRTARRLVADTLADGAAGIAVGLDYFPQTAASTEELLDLGRLAADADRPLVAHVRGAALGIADGVAEIVDVGARTGAAIHVSHLRHAAALPVIDAARAAGQDVTFDVYPYTRSSTLLVSHLPSWALEGGPTVLRRRLTDPGERRRIGAELGPAFLREAAGMRVANLGCGDDDAWIGGSVAAALAAIGGGLGDALSELLLRNDLAVGYVGTTSDDVDEASLEACLAHPASMPCSDAILVGQRPHPRGWGAAPRYLGRYIRERALLPLEEAVRRMTSAPADRFGLGDRGRVRTGAVADLVVFDPSTIVDGSTDDGPRLPPAGIDAVIIAGRLVAGPGADDGLRPGEVIRVGASAGWPRPPD